MITMCFEYFAFVVLGLIVLYAAARLVSRAVLRTLDEHNDMRGK